jgi:hypothetical protein
LAKAKTPADRKRPPNAFRAPDEFAQAGKRKRHQRPEPDRCESKRRQSADQQSDEEMHQAVIAVSAPTKQSTKGLRDELRWLRQPLSSMRSGSEGACTDGRLAC